MDFDGTDILELQDRFIPTEGLIIKLRKVLAGDRLDLIAWSEYGDVSLWYIIAEVNDLDPREFPPEGNVLIIPRIPRE